MWMNSATARWTKDCKNIYRAHANGVIPASVISGNLPKNSHLLHILCCMIRKMTCLQQILMQHLLIFRTFAAAKGYKLNPNDQNLLSINKNQRNMEFTKKVFSTVVVLRAVSLSGVSRITMQNMSTG